MGKKTGSSGRFGARYGKTIRKKIKVIEELQKKKQFCPYCRTKKAKRLSMGIFLCNKCSSKFTAKAYNV